jgi:hypothetical protein
MKDVAMGGRRRAAHGLMSGARQRAGLAEAWLQAQAQ